MDIRTIYMYASLDLETRAIFLHVRGEVKMGRVLSCNQHRLSDQQRRLDRLHLRSDNRELRTTNTTNRRKMRTETRRWHWLQLRRSGDGVDAPPRLASLGLLDLTRGERHVWVPDQQQGEEEEEGHVRVPDPLPVQLLLGPEQPLQHHRQLALGALSMLCS